MAKFGHLAKYDPKGRTSTITLPIVAELADGTRPNAKLHVRHAGESNNAWRNAVNKHNAKTGLARRAAMRTDDTGEIARRRDLDLYPIHIVTGWDDVYDEDGAPVPFSQDACREFLDAIPNWIFDDIRMHCVQAINFLDDEEPTAAEIEDVAGN